MTHKVQPLLRFAFLGLLALTVLMDGYAQDTSGQSIVASIEGKYTISFADIQQYVYDSHLIYMYRRNKAKVYQKAVDEKIVNQLKLIDFFALGLNENAELLSSIKREMSEELVVRYYETQFYEKYVDEDSMRIAYKELGKEVLYQQIVLPKPKHASQKDLGSLKLRAESIGQQLREGADFAEVAKNFSQHSELSRPGGFMPPLNWEMSLAGHPNDIIFHLAAHEVRVIDSKESISIVRVAEVRRRDVPPYEQVKDKVRQSLAQRHGDFTLQEFERMKKRLIDEKTLWWNPKAVRLLVRWSNIPHFYEKGYPDTLRESISHGRNLVILRYSKGRVDLSEYLRLLNDVLIWGKVDSVREENVKKYILEAVRTDMLVKKATSLNLERDIFHAETRNPVLRNEILRLYDLHEIEDRIPVASEKALKDFYQTHKDSLFYQLAKVNVYAVIDSNKQIIDEAKHKLEQNVPFEKLASEIFVKTYVRKRDGTFDTYFEDEPPYLGEAAFRLELNEIAGPIEYVDSAKGIRYALIKCMAIRGEKQLSYEDVEKTITDDFIKYCREEITKATQNNLKRKYTITVYKDVLNHILASMGISLQ